MGSEYLPGKMVDINLARVAMICGSIFTDKAQASGFDIGQDKRDGCAPDAPLAIDKAVEDIGPLTQKL